MASLLLLVAAERWGMKYEQENELEVEKFPENAKIPRSPTSEKKVGLDSRFRRPAIYWSSTTRELFSSSSPLFFLSSSS